MSLAQIGFGREIHDTMPFKQGKGAMHKEWMITAEDREKALAKRHHTNMERLNEHEAFTGGTVSLGPKLGRESR